jgi:hypothetical protein
MAGVVGAYTCLNKAMEKIRVTSIAERLHFLPFLVNNSLLHFQITLA